MTEYSRFPMEIWCRIYWQSVEPGKLASFGKVKEKLKNSGIFSIISNSVKSWGFSYTLL